MEGMIRGYEVDSLKLTVINDETKFFLRKT